MLSLGTQLPNFYIIREELYCYNYDYICIDIGKTRNRLCNMLDWGETTENNIFIPEYSINDFIFICFTVGNDFLPHIPSIEIIQDGIELLLDVYKQVASSYGHLTIKKNGDVKFNKKT